MPPPTDTFDIAFAPAWTARAVVVDPDVGGDELLRLLGLRAGSAVVALTGSTVAGSADDPVLVEAIAGGLGPAALDSGWHVVTGATDAGIFSLLGRAAAAAGAVPAPWIGVAPLDLVTWPGRPPGAADLDREPLEPHHSHAVLVRGDRWGDEMPVQVALVDALAAGGPGLVVLAGGGAVARKEIVGHVRAGRSLLVLGGTGRLADELAGMARGGPSEDGPAEDGELALVAASGRLAVCDVSDGPMAVAAAVTAAMAQR